MTFESKLKSVPHEQIWQEYCGFLELDLADYMRIQRRLMAEQIELWSACELASPFLKGRSPRGIEEFRSMMPLTHYEDYADVLLQKRSDMLPAEPIIWVQTTWEGGRHPFKVAPYTEGMLETFRSNVVACLILATSKEPGVFTARPGDTMLYALAPLPYVTGLLPLALGEEIGIEFLPPVKDATRMGFGERNKRGFELGLRRGGIDYFFGLGSVAYYVSAGISALGNPQKKKGKHRDLFSISPRMLMKLGRAKMRCRREGREMLPRDIFSLKGFMCAGTDNACYKDELEAMWGVRPMEIFAGTEPSCVGTETWTRDGMYFFPDTCFYEFIPRSEMQISLHNPGYQPRTCLMDEVLPGETYELVISLLKGGAFMRYRVGDVYRCVGLENSADRTRIPRFSYVDRVPTVIDIAGFTRITEYTVESAIELSGLQIEDWTAYKKYSDAGRPYLAMVVEMSADSIASAAVSRELLREHLSIYFKYVDQDYGDLKRLLGIEPLEITIVPCGTFERYRSETNRILERINSSPYDVKELLLT